MRFRDRILLLPCFCRAFDVNNHLYRSCGANTFRIEARLWSNARKCIDRRSRRLSPSVRSTETGMAPALLTKEIP
jgi:hypothetical protein